MSHGAPALPWLFFFPSAGVSRAFPGHSVVLTSPVTQPRPRFLLPHATGTLALGGRTLVMGIVNVTPDSFADGGLRLDPARAIEDALRMVEDGADLLDVGAESTRPGAAPLPEREELARLLPVLEGLAGRLTVPLSVDTYKAAIAAAALERGASIVNDVSALAFDPALAGVVEARGAALILMHTRGRSADMYAQARYGDVAGEVTSELGARVDAAVAAGVPRERIVVDPGPGLREARRPQLRRAGRAGAARGARPADPRGAVAQVVRGRAAGRAGAGCPGVGHGRGGDGGRPRRRARRAGARRPGDGGRRPGGRPRPGGVGGRGGPTAGLKVQ